MLTNTEILRGWSQIERYLGLTRNTILNRGYPVRKDGGVFAYKAELDSVAKNKPLVTSLKKFMEIHSNSQ